MDWLQYDIVFIQSKKEGKDQESTHPSTTPEPGHQWESDSITTRHHKREPRDQPFPHPTPAGDHKASTDLHESITKQDRNNTNNTQKKHHPGTVSKNILLEGLISHWYPGSGVVLLIFTLFLTLSIRWQGRETTSHIQNQLLSFQY